MINPSGRKGTPDSHFNEIWMADVLGRMIRNGVFMANEWALTVMLINLSLEEQRKAIQIGDQAGVQTETWLFDPTHNAENMRGVELSSEITVSHTLHPALALIM